MKTHFAPFTDLDDIDQAPYGTWLGESSELSGDWDMVDCQLCKKRRERIIAAAADEERVIVDQIGRHGGIHACARLDRYGAHL